MILAEIKKLVQQRTAEILARQGAAAEVPSFDLSVPPSHVPGDLATNVVLMIAKRVGQPPRRLAEEMIDGFPASDLIQKIEIAGQGFLNFWLSDAAFGRELASLVQGGSRDLAAGAGSKRILLEFVSANPTGPLHVGHGRGAALGDSLVRVFRYLGFDTTAEFYVNDAGGQIRNLGLSVESRVRELRGEPSEFPENGYRGGYVLDIAKEAAASGRQYRGVTETQMVFDENDLAGFASARLLKGIQRDLADFGVGFDSWFYESSLHKKNAVPNLFSQLKKKGCAYEEGGALWFRSTDYGDEKDRVLQKANEAPTYFASDIAYHLDKHARGFRRLINVWGADHHGYALRLKGAMKALGVDDVELDIVLNQLVSLKGGRLSKRAGDMITLREVFEEVGKDAARFFFALRSPGTHFEFDLDLAKKQAPDNPVYYVQYVHARCCSIFREAEKRNMAFDPSAWAKRATPAAFEPEERAVLLHLSSFGRSVELCAKDCSSHHLTIYLLELAGKYHSFYERCHVLVDDPAQRERRLALVEAIRRRVAEGLDLLGVSAPSNL